MLLEYSRMNSTLVPIYYKPCLERGDHGLKIELSHLLLVQPYFSYLYLAASILAEGSKQG